MLGKYAANRVVEQLFRLCMLPNKQNETESLPYEVMAEENGTGSNAVWAIALVVVVAIIAGVVYYSGVLKTKPGKDTDINIKVDAPAAPAPAR